MHLETMRGVLAKRMNLIGSGFKVKDFTFMSPQEFARAKLRERNEAEMLKSQSQDPSQSVQLPPQNIEMGSDISENELDNDAAIAKRNLFEPSKCEKSKISVDIAKSDKKVMAPKKSSKSKSGEKIEKLDKNQSTIKPTKKDGPQ